VAQTWYPGGVLQIRVPLYAGALDELLGMAERGEVDVARLGVAEVIEQCLGVLRALAKPDADLLAEMIGYTSRLMVLKSSALLPRPAVMPPLETAESAADIEAWLAEYRMFKQAAAAFRGRQEEGLRSFPRLAPPPAPLPAPPLPGHVTLERLLALVQEALSRRPPDLPGTAPRLVITVRQRLAELEAALEREGRVSFSRFIAESRSRIEIVVGFMAVLELIKRGRAAAEQETPFGDILIVGLAPAGVAAD
jgi:segregation and condensation protein A